MESRVTTGAQSLTTTANFYRTAGTTPTYVRSALEVTILLMMLSHAVVVFPDEAFEGRRAGATQEVCDNCAPSIGRRSTVDVKYLRQTPHQPVGQDESWRTVQI